MKLLRYLILCVAVCTLHSCDNVTEEIHLKEDGSGEYKLYADMIPSIRMMATEFAGMFGDSTGQETKSDAEIEEFIWKDFPQGDIDSVFDYTESLDSASAADPKNKELLKRMSGFMEGGRSKGYVNMGVKFNFDNLADLQKITKAIEENQRTENSGKGGDMAGMEGLDDLKTESKYAMKNNIFTRTTKFISKPKVKEDEMGMYTMMFGTTKMRTIVYMPKPVKDVKGGATAIKEGNKVTFEYSLMDYILGKTTNDFEIVTE